MLTNISILKIKLVHHLRHRLSSFQDLLDADLTLVYVRGGTEENLLSTAHASSAMGRVYRQHSKGVHDYQGWMELP